MKVNLVNKVQTELGKAKSALSEAWYHLDEELLDNVKDAEVKHKISYLHEDVAKLITELDQRLPQGL